MATCKSCGARIRWAVTEAGKRMLIDVRPPPGWAIERSGDTRRDTCRRCRKEPKP